MADFNQQVIEEFRGNSGRVGGPFEGSPMVLLHHTGARTGTERVTPLMSRPDGDDLYIFASKAGAPDNPDWFHNLVANPEVVVEVPAGDGIATRPVRAEVVEGDERERAWEGQKQDWPQFAGYEASTDRVIPVIALRPRA